MASFAELRTVLHLFPAVKIATTTIPLSFFDFFTVVYAVSVYAASTVWALKVAATLLGMFMVMLRD